VLTETWIRKRNGTSYILGFRKQNSLKLKPKGASKTRSSQSATEYLPCLTYLLCTVVPFRWVAISTSFADSASSVKYQSIRKPYQDRDFINNKPLSDNVCLVEVGISYQAIIAVISCAKFNADKLFHSCYCLYLSVQML
jgi:hypothetical protein